MTNPTESAAWNTLTSMSQTVPSLRNLIPGDRGFLRLKVADIWADFSRQRVTEAIFQELLFLSSECGVLELRDSMFRGDRINTTENRSVLHTALRMPAGSELIVDGVNVVEQVHVVLDRMAHLSNAIRDGSWTGATGKRISHVVNIGIGGSDLGPAMAYEALGEFVNPDIRISFVSNVDPTDLTRVLQGADPQTTLFVVVSKTFTTTETMSNAKQARKWLTDALLDEMGVQPSDSVPAHFVAVSTNEAHVREFGIDPDNMFGFWDWVGGRYSMDSAVGLSTMIAIGSDNFSRMLAGMHHVDQHFLTQPPDENVPLIMGLLGVWNRNFLQINSTAVLPYSQYLARFPAYLQQLTMESNGKRVRKDGSPVSYDTGAIYWGEPGTNGQHSFYQLLHQGTSSVTADIIVIAHAHSDLGSQQQTLVANALAQASVLALGVTQQEVEASGVESELVPHKVMLGDKPVTVLMTKELTPHSLGALIALYEHSTFVQGAIWGIDSFDQWGVELGKNVALGIDAVLSQGSGQSDFDASTQWSIDQFRRLQG